MAHLSVRNGATSIDARPEYGNRPAASRAAGLARRVRGPGARHSLSQLAGQRPELLGVRLVRVEPQARLDVLFRGGAEALFQEERGQVPMCDGALRDLQRGLKRADRLVGAVLFFVEHSEIVERLHEAR